MNEVIIEEISKDLGISKKQVITVLKLLEEGNTIPFISRYRKEATGALNEEVIKSIDDVYQYQVNLLKRKEDVIRLIDEKGLLTDELKLSIMKCSKLVEVDDLYRPYKEKKKTKATDAIKNGLEPLAKIIMSCPTRGNIDTIASKYLNDKVKTVEDAIIGAKYIIAEWISDNAYYRKWIRSYIFKEGVVVSKLKKNVNDEDKTYSNYYDFTETIKYIKPHRILAINRGEKDGVLSVKLDYDVDKIIKYLETKVIKNKESFCYEIIVNAINDSLKRLILPSVDREVRSELKEKGEVRAIDNFSVNVENLLLTPPLKDKTVLGFDPAFRTGCKLAVLDKTGKVLEIAVIYPTEPHNDIEGSKKRLLELIDKYDIDVIAIGNGTASRESESFVADAIKSCKRDVSYIIVSEAGASVYSASKLAIEEFPDLTVEKRSAVSIGRRVQDALSELVKIDPKSIGVGLYQHDVPVKKLDESLKFVVSKAVNGVGVNINTASPSILKYVSGLNKKVIDNIITFRESYGKFKNRKELLSIKGMSDKVYEQAVGFLRILDGDNPLDKTSIHPESYDKTRELLDYLGYSEVDLGTKELIDKLNSLDVERISKEIDVDKYTLDDIIKSLEKPMRDLRDSYPQPILRNDILHIEDLKIGDKLQGTVRNVVDFGLFIDVGLKNDGLAHISKLTHEYIKNPSDLFSVGDIVDCYVESIDLDKKKVNLSLIN
jgi:hypothetical protein